MPWPVRAHIFQVLVDAVGRAAIPVLSYLLLSRYDIDELAELAAQVQPAARDVLDQRLPLVLRQQADLANAGIHAVGKHEIDDAELATERRGRLAAMLGQPAQALAAASGHDHGKCAAGETADVATGGCARCVDHCTLYLPQPDYIQELALLPVPTYIEARHQSVTRSQPPWNA